MSPITPFRRLLLAAAATLGAYAAQAQNNPVASSLVMNSLMPVVNLNEVPEPAELAHYYDGARKDLQPALDWMHELNSVRPTYWTLYTEARIQLALKHYPEAAALAGRTKRLTMLAAPDNSPYLALSARLLSEVQQVLPGTEGEVASVK